MATVTMIRLMTHDGDIVASVALPYLQDPPTPGEWPTASIQAILEQGPRQPSDEMACWAVQRARDRVRRCAEPTLIVVHLRR